MKNRILVIGPGKKTEGGITSLIKEYEKTELWKKFKCTWIETYNNKNNFLKISYFLSGFIRFLFLLPFYRLVHIHFSWKLSLIRKVPFFVLAKLFGKKVIIHLHSGAEPVLESGVKGIYQYFFKNADITILLAHEIKSQLLKEFKFKKIVVVYNPSLVQTEVNDFEKEKKILFAGHINDKKGIFDLILAFSSISNQFPTWKLVIAGSGNVQKMNDLINSLKISEQTEFLGWIKDQDKNDTFKKCSVFCLPSYTEGFPMSVLEAWAYGLAVITTPVGGLPDVLEHGKNAMVFKPGDVNGLAKNLKELMDSEQLRNKLSENSYQLINTVFNIKSITEKMEDIYLNVT